MNEPMTASDLAGMLEGWPEGARPKLEFRGWHPDDVEPYHWRRDDPENRSDVHDTDAIDLATASGLRWLMANDARVEVLILNDGLYVLWLSEQRRFEGHTLLHAIDAAVRATAESGPTNSL